MQPAIVLIFIAFLIAPNNARAAGEQVVIAADAQQSDEIECRRVRRKGSFTTVRVCVPKSEWEEERRRSADMVERHKRDHSDNELGRHDRWF